ncbi:uncharacterized protein EV420DRAFT_1753339 [Desarmillaria tabescens]|uniref:Uncharacterized protein n=1 Tax=Armillaria tabescens TaxID=1929756 RepID=A0AA39MKR5_ARMTA|nr:uncharacterized protein EV420DRAFT_1753339 [Desarmillaria tabescens]KAK0437927.1 hypothetical protein EV420DRAFT_1753339 [Desarmillaria tabescens]
MTILRFTCWSRQRLRSQGISGNRKDIKGLQNRQHSPDNSTSSIYFSSFITMRLSIAALIPLAALAVPALSASVQARDDSVGYNGYNDGGSGRNYGKDYGHNDGGSKDWGKKDDDKKDDRKDDRKNDGGSKDFGRKDDDKDDRKNDGGSKDFGKDKDDKDHKRKGCTWEPVFEHKKDFRGWNKGKYTPYDHKDVKKDSYEIDCKNLCEKDDKCNSCQAYSKEENEEKFICELFEEIIDILTWEDDCDDDKDRKDDRKNDGGSKDFGKDGKKDDKDRKDDHKYYDTSCWNAHYSY